MRTLKQLFKAIKEEDERSDSCDEDEEVRNNDKNYTDDELSESEMRKMQSGLLNVINSFESQFKCTVPTD